MIFCVWSKGAFWKTSLAICLMATSCTDSKKIKEVVKPAPAVEAAHGPAQVSNEPQKPESLADTKPAVVPDLTQQPQLNPPPSAPVPDEQAKGALTDANAKSDDTKPITKQNRPISPDCQAVATFPNDDPLFLNNAKLMFTRITGPCYSPSGTVGHMPNSSWMVMGVPCTGGEGRIDWKGTNYTAPKMVSFLLDTTCAMAPTDHQKLRQLVIEEMRLSPSSTMAAFNPFMVQYWEFPGLDDADATFSVDLRSGRGLTKVWNDFIKEKPIPVTLFGRENAWVPGNHLYQVDAELIWASRNRFRIRVNKAHVLKDEELAAVKARCEALRPERDCGKVF